MMNDHGEAPTSEVQNVVEQLYGTIVISLVAGQLGRVGEMSDDDRVLRNLIDHSAMSALNPLVDQFDLPANIEELALYGVTAAQVSRNVAVRGGTGSDLDPGESMQLASVLERSYPDIGRQLTDRAHTLIKYSAQSSATRTSDASEALRAHVRKYC